MQLRKFLLSSIFSILLIACAAPNKETNTVFIDYVPIKNIQIKSKFESSTLTKDNFGKEARNCVSGLFNDQASLSKALDGFPNSSISSYTHNKSAKIFTVYKTTGLCIERSAESYPILAAEALLETVNLKGIPFEVEDDWNKKIVLLLATKGTARIAYVNTSGTAYIATYKITTLSTYSHAPFTLSYSNAFKKIGEWENGTYDYKFSNPLISSLSVIKRNNYEEKIHPLLHRLK